MTNKEFFISKLCEYAGNEDAVDRLLEILGNEKLETASFAINVDSGSAYDGALVDNAIKLTTIAIGLNNMLPEEKKINVASIVKVCLLQHISKVVMFMPNPNDWDRKRGNLYTFTDSNVSLRAGERSILIAYNAGFSFTEEEYEAMRIIDKDTSNDVAAKLHSSSLAMIINMANDMLFLKNRK